MPILKNAVICRKKQVYMWILYGMGILKNIVGTSPTLADFEKLWILLLQLKIFFKMQKQNGAIFA
jgi:hypothetical protein